MKKILFIGLTIILWTSCDDFLDKNPDNRASLDTPENIAALLISAYPEYSHIWFTEVMSDNATDIGITAGADNIWLRQAYHWERVEFDAQDTPDAYWHACYSAIASANHALQAITELENSGMYRQTELNQLKGEAFLCRAYAHFMLVNLFAEHYNPAADSEGIPYVTKPETKPIAEYLRHSVAEVYELIEKDILAGFPLIREELYEAPKWHFNRKAAALFISRYYLYRGLPDDWDKVIHYANLAVEGNPSKFLRDWLTTSNESFDVFGTNYSRSTNFANFLIISNISSAVRAWYHRYSMDLDLIRKRVVSGEPHPTSTNITNQFVFINKVGGNSTLGCYSVFKFVEVFKRNSINANFGLPYVMNVPFVAEEAIFNQMEAEVMKENYDKVIELLNLYYSTRVINYNADRHIVTDAIIQRKYAGTQIASEVAPHFSLNEKQQTYLKCIINIRATEFIAEGQRWFDIKRMYLPVIHSIHGGSPIVLERDDPRRVIPLPQDVNENTFMPGSNLVPPALQVGFDHFAEFSKMVEINSEKQK